MPAADIPRIHVSEATRAVAELYERGRNTLEYHDADIVRRVAIERVLKRLLAFGMLGGDLRHAEGLVKELVRAGYFPNDTIPEEYVGEVALLLRRFLTAQEAGIPPQLASFFLSLTAIAVEDALTKEEREMERHFVRFAFFALRDRIPWTEAERQEKRHHAMLYAAVWRDVLHADEKRTLAALLRDALPEWEGAGEAQEVAVLLQEACKVIRASQLLLRLPAFVARRKVARAFSPAFIALRDAFAHHPDDIGEVAASPVLFEELLEETVRERASATTRGLRWTALRATLYVFITKMLVGLAVEVPYELFVLSSFHTQAFFVNLLAPPFLMFMVALTTSPPSQRAIGRIVETASLIALEDGMLKAPRRAPARGNARTAAYTFAAIFLTAGIVWGMVKILGMLAFSWAAVAVFIFFISIVSLFAWRVRKPLRDLGLSGTAEGFLPTVGEIMIFPFLAMGRALSHVLGGFSLFLFMLDVFIESPLKLLLGFVEDWIVFLREKREEFIEES